MDNNESKKNIFCVSIDGSIYSNYGFDITFSELYKKGDRLEVVHIYNPEKTDLPYEAQPKTILSKYTTICSGKFSNSDYDVIVTEKKSSDSHAIDALYSVAVKHSATAIVMGYQGYKVKDTQDHLSKGIIYMLRNISIPTFIIKECCFRNKKESGGFNWAVFIEDQDTKSYASFQKAINFIHPNKDKVIGYSILNSKEEKRHNLEQDFKSICETAKIKNFSFNIIEKTEDSIGKMMCDIVNFGNDNADFAVVGHNVAKYNQINSSPTIDMIKNAQANIFYYSSSR